MKNILRLLLLVLCLYDVNNAFTQTNPYVLNGSATQDNCHCYTLTQDITNESGSIWNKNKIDLNQPFDYFFNVNLGCNDASGADGIVFVLQPVSTSLGSVGEGIGFSGIQPSLGVEIDTYQNENQADPFYDHIAILQDGSVAHNVPTNLAGPVQALANSTNIEDCKFHILHISWQPANNLMEVSMDGVLRLSLTKDIVASIFHGDPNVFWGFTSATGGLSNVQRMCTSLDAKYILAAHNNTCIGTPLTFFDSSISFGSITNWYWNFGDGSTSTEKNPPNHLYKNPATYNVTLNVKGGDGCLSDTFKQQIVIGSFPVADFNENVFPVCTNRSAVFTDASTLISGTANKWFWNFGNGNTSTAQNPPPQLYTVGDYIVKYSIESKEGCASDTIQKNIHVSEAPSINLTTSATQACKNDNVNFNLIDNSSAIGIKKWYLDYGDGSFSTNELTQHVYKDSGNYMAKVVAEAENGCLTDTISKPIKVYATNANAGKDTTVLIDYPYQIEASGGIFYTWTPSAGLSNAFISNPVARPLEDQTYILTTTTTIGCATTDTLHLKVAKGPKIYAPGAFTPNGDGKNDRFKIIPVGVPTIKFFSIYNRWGQLIYSSVKVNEGWDGSFKGIPQPVGAYIWIASGIGIDGKTISAKNTVVLIR